MSSNLQCVLQRVQSDGVESGVLHCQCRTQECIVEVHVQDAKGVGVIRGCKGPTFQLNFSTNIIEHLKWSQGPNFVLVVNL